MTLWQLKAFATVAKEGSFTKAGKALNISQPSASALVIGLEKELKVKLFEKLGVRPHLTEAGRRLLKLAETVLSTVDKIPDEMDQVKGLKKGRLMVGGAGIATATFLPVAIQKFKKEYPGVDVDLTIQTSEALEQKLLEGNIDLAILSWLPRSRLLLSELYLEEDVVAIAPPRHPLTKRRSVPLTLLAKQPLVTYEKGTPIRNMLEKKFAEKGIPAISAVEVNLQMGSRDAIRGVVANGLGIGFLSKVHVMSDVKAGRLKILKVPELNIKRTMYIVVHKNQQRSPLVRAFIDFLRGSKGRP
ncbi:MAG TPA: LysR family transcriptional regulator [Candidatus Binatia bacterium]